MRISHSCRAIFDVVEAFCASSSVGLLRIILLSLITALMAFNVAKCRANKQIEQQANSHG